MRLIFTHCWNSDLFNGKDIYPIIHDSPEAAYVDFCESYKRFRAEMDFMESQRTKLQWYEFYEKYGTKPYYFIWKGIEFYNLIDVVNDINFQTLDEFFAKVET